jgi:hypothetical protein
MFGFVRILLGISKPLDAMRANESNTVTMLGGARFATKQNMAG